MPTTTLKSINDLQAEYQSLIAGVLNENVRETLLFNYFGDFNQAKVDSILQMVESSIIESGDKRQTMKRICSVLIEMLQNISIHGAKLPGGRMHAYCIVIRGESTYRLLTGNLVLAVDIACLEARLEELLKMDINAIRKAFIETLCNDDFNMKGGAGLGLLTIAKRSEDKINYKIHRLSEQLGYYQLDVKIAKSESQ